MVSLKTVKDFVIQNPIHNEKMNDTGFSQTFLAPYITKWYVCPNCGSVAEVSVMATDKCESRYIATNKIIITGADINLNVGCINEKCSNMYENCNYSPMFECDMNIVPYISRIIKKTYTTLYCCEGHVYPDGGTCLPYLLMEADDDIDGNVDKSIKNVFKNNKTIGKYVSYHYDTRTVDCATTNEDDSVDYYTKKLPCLRIEMRFNWLSNLTSEELLSESGLRKFYLYKKNFIKTLKLFSEELPDVE